MLSEQRRQIILQMVQDTGMVTAEELVAALSVSQMTIWRDLIALEQQARVRRVRGGVARIESGSSGEPLYKSKQVVQKEKKVLIARYAASHFVEDDDIIFLEAGTTVGAMIKFLTQHNLTVVSNGLGNLNELSLMVPDIAVLSCGGIMRDIAYTFVGPQAEEFFQNMRAKTLFLGATGLAFPEGITDPSPLEIQVKRAMAGSAGRVVLLIDSTKFGVRSLAQIIPLEKIQAIVSDAGAPQEDIERLRELGIEVHIAF